MGNKYPYHIWVMLQSLRRRNCTYAILDFQESVQEGLYEGVGNVYGTVHPVRSHQQTFLNRIQKYKEKPSDNVSLFISPGAMVFRLEYPNLPTLKIMIKGKSGFVYEGSRRIGFTSFPRHSLKEFAGLRWVDEGTADSPTKSASEKDPGGADTQG
jgi:hypothetical protein